MTNLNTLLQILDIDGARAASFGQSHRRYHFYRMFGHHERLAGGSISIIPYYPHLASPAISMKALQ